MLKSKPPQQLTPLQPAAALPVRCPTLIRQHLVRPTQDPRGRPVTVVSPFPVRIDRGGFRALLRANPLVNRHTGLCLDSNQDNGMGNGFGAVYTMRCNGGNNQRWF
ncbi:hypothetical protein ABZ667_31930 [Streptomyces lavendulae]|uniref:hypothetical protein n=1 Tax=Streptomyces lavendulae TaxID=1914 RepID=UPI0033C4EA91